MSSGGCADHPVGYNSSLQIKMAIWRTFFEFELNIGRVWGPAVDYYCCFALFKTKYPKVMAYFLQRAATPDQITQQNSLQRSVGP
jgi:hypothetical protein